MSQALDIVLVTYLRILEEQLAMPVPFRFSSEKSIWEQEA